MYAVDACRAGVHVGVGAPGQCKLINACLPDTYRVCTVYCRNDVIERTKNSDYREAIFS